jgi:hypothetical protein
MREPPSFIGDIQARGMGGGIGAEALETPRALAISKKPPPPRRETRAIMTGCVMVISHSHILCDPVAEVISLPILGRLVVDDEDGRLAVPC